MSQNFLSGINYQLVIERVPNVSYFAQDVTIPSLGGSSTTLNTPFKEINVAGGALTFSDLVVNFKVDEDLLNYKEMFSWFQKVTTQDGFYQSEPSKEVSDLKLLIFGSNGKQVGSFTFKDSFPTQMSGFNVTSSSQDINYISVSVTLKFNQMFVD